MTKVAESLSSRLPRATELIERRLRPAAVLLYGSAASDRMRAGSDVDLAVLMGGPPPDPFALASVRTDVEALLEHDVELVVLDAASPILAMEVLRRHRVLANREPGLLEGFVVRTLTAYFDLKQVRRPIEEALLRPAAPA